MGHIVLEQPRWDTDSLELVCGIANAGGGRIIVTSNIKDRTTGFRRMRKPFEQLPAVIFRELGIDCTTAPIMQNGVLCLEVDIPGALEPVALYGTYWLYTPDGNQPKTREDLLQAQRDSAALEWEHRPLPFAKREDMSADALFAIGAIALPDLDIEDMSLFDTLESRLEHIGLTRPHTKELTNAGALLLSIRPSQFIPGASVRVVAFEGVSGQAVSNVELTGPLAQQLAKTTSYILDQYTQGGVFAARTLIPGFALPPDGALREVLANALIHKDYESGVPVRVSLHPDRIIINSAGGLPEGWDAAKLREAHPPRPRNPLLASTARLLGLVSGWGNGLGTVFKACENSGVTEPAFRVTDDEVQTTFSLTNSQIADEPAPSASVNQADESERALKHIGGGPLQSKFTEHSIAAANRLDMTSTDEYVLRVLATNGRATAVRIAEVLGVSERTVRRSFKKLRELEFIERIGSDKAGYWRIK